MGMAPSVFRSAQDGGCSATTARRAASPDTGGSGDECLDRQADQWRERALAGAATALKERERDDRDDESARLLLLMKPTIGSGGCCAWVPSRRVDATLIPHRSGRAEFPLPVLHGRASLTVVSLTPSRTRRSRKSRR
jgi:hypothetical protein